MTTALAIDSGDRGENLETIAVLYFDGATSTQLSASLRVQHRGIHVVTDRHNKTFAIEALRLTGLQGANPWLLYCPDGGVCQVQASAALYQRLLALGAKRESLLTVVSRLESDWRLAAMSITFLVTVIAAFYVWLLPALAQVGAPLVPAAVQSRMGAAVFEEMEARWLVPSTLPREQQDAIRTRFHQLLGERTNYEVLNQYTLYIRKSRIGPNAFTLPGKRIIITDELVALVDGDLDAVSGVLAHELGHVKHNHGIRSVIQASALTMLGSALIGDYSSVLATIPATLGHLHYSREFEAEADVHAHALLCAKGINPSHTSRFFDKVAASDAGKRATLIPEYLQSHPQTARRAEFFHTPC